MDLFNNIFYFVIIIGILVFVHEFGHFIAARLTKMRVDTFSLGMGFRLLGYNRKSGFSFGSLPKDFDGEGKTDYRLSLFPIGGYVKIAGMVDESMDVEFAKSEPKPWEFRSKNTLQKAFAISAGVIMNALLAIIVFSVISFTQGKTYRATNNIAYIDKGSIAENIGLMAGDKFVSINGEKIQSIDEFDKFLAIDDFDKKLEIQLIRNGEEQTIFADNGKIIKDLSMKKQFGLHPDHISTIFLAVQTLMPAGKAGMLAGDTVISINGEKVHSFTEFQSIIKNHKNKAVFIEWKSGASIKSDSVTPNEDGMIGVQITQLYTGPITQQYFSIFESISNGFSETYRSLNLFLGTITQIVGGNLSMKSAVGGPILIAQMASRQAELGIVNFLHFLALLSITLAVINILPFPALDGGHLVFIIIEGIIRREVSIKVKMAFQQVGFVLLLLFMAFVVYNDITR